MPPTPPHRIQIENSDSTPAALPMGGINPQGSAIRANQRYLTLDGRPWLPVMGEFHFSRYSREDWEFELLKMKAGGIQIIASYIFWIHMEEIKGQTDWTGRNDLRAFVQLCAKHGLYAYLRIGPWAHGECRNGGFPDWLLETYGSAVRQDAEPYLTYVRQWYAAIYQQARGLLWKDGGPVIGIQLENELLDNAAHILTLKRLAQEAGFDVPLYTMTGWGPAEVPGGGQVIPVFGGYPDAFWERQTATWARDSRKHYFFSHVRDDNAIGADLNRKTGLASLDIWNETPYGTCEIGAGMQVAYHRRPWIEPKDVAALAYIKIGSGSNWQGYYMYHGGSHPLGRRGTLNETQASGYWNDVPAINYDFQTALGQFGQVRASYHHLKLLHLFLQEYGEQLAPYPCWLPDQQPRNLDDRGTLRWSARSNGASAFLFINNYQRIEQLPGHTSVQFQAAFPGGQVQVPTRPVRIPAGFTAIWPINFDLYGARLAYATAQPVCRLAADAPLEVYFARPGARCEFAFLAASIQAVEGPCHNHQEGELLLLDGLKPGPACLLKITPRMGPSFRLLVFDEANALYCWKTHLWGIERLVLSKNALAFTPDTLWVEAQAGEAVTLTLFPAPENPPVSSGLTLLTETSGIFTRYSFQTSEHPVLISTQQTAQAGPAREIPMGPAGVAQQPADADYDAAETWRVQLPPGIFDDQDAVFLKVKYAGDAARAYLQGRLVADDFYSGHPWEIELSKFGPEVLDHGLELRFLPLRRDAPIYLPPEHRPAFDGPEILQVSSIQAYAMKRYPIRLPTR